MNGYSGLYDEWQADINSTTPDLGGLEGYTAGSEWDYTGQLSDDSFNMDAYQLTQIDPYDYTNQYYHNDTSFPSLESFVAPTPSQAVPYQDSLLGSSETFNTELYQSQQKQASPSILSSIAGWLGIATTGIQTYKMATTDVPRTAQPRSGVPINISGTTFRTPSILPTSNDPFPAPNIIRTAAPVQKGMDEKTKAALALGAVAVVLILFLRKK